MQGIIILSYVICNIEGLSLRYRALIPTGLLLGREMGLRRTDHQPNVPTADTLEAEIGRRVWWYLTATDWYAAHGKIWRAWQRRVPVKSAAHEREQATEHRRRRLIHQQSQPLSQQTDMSYFLQRIRLAEIPRNIVDRIGSDPSNRRTHIMAMDYELVEMMNEIPKFLQLDSYQNTIGCTKSSQIYIQAYFLNTLLHTQTL
ncbi:hypothetical protein G6011_06502 [Alternaria panax]|uniref:Transcription factor domain-containing protein n=1 Tax=Alternaria panax TaxID=48097 RepID=A0AAD4FLG5_9PLEO|nr:hypothetical protein G6011_06502 [Alternaria panax]